MVRKVKKERERKIEKERERRDEEEVVVVKRERRANDD